MTDRELLEAAAKAAGIELTDFHGLLVIPDAKAGCPPWNPLEDDGDALRLAVKLGIGVLYAEFSGEAEARWNRGTFRLAEYGPDDPCVATRRAIVRAAASMVDA